MRKQKPEVIWHGALRMIMGGYWMFFSYQKWFDRSWAVGLLAIAAQGNTLPIYGQMLRDFVIPHATATAVLMTLVEAAVGCMLILGVLTRLAAALGALMDLNLIMVFSFCNCPAASDLPLIFWFYFAPFLLNVQLTFDQSSETMGVQALLKKLLANRRGNKSTLEGWKIRNSESSN